DRGRDLGRQRAGLAPTDADLKGRRSLEVGFLVVDEQDKLVALVVVAEPETADPELVRERGREVARLRGGGRRLGLADLVRAELGQQLVERHPERLKLLLLHPEACRAEVGRDADAEGALAGLADRVG